MTRTTLRRRSVVKLGSTDGLTGHWVQAAGLIALLSACASTPTEPVKERLDPDTATMVTVMDHPVELLAERIRGPVDDPFAYIAPFETNRMGERALFLWASAPEIAGARVQPQLLCNGEPVGLQPLDGDLAQISLSRPPYSAPSPWSAQWYFRLPPDGLKCLATAQGIALETRASQGVPERFSADGKRLTALEAFSRR
jgi:hypothetical protein